jgi:hypothetical protein
MRIKLIFFCSVIAVTAFAAKVRNWQTGTLLDSESSSVYLGMISSTSSSGTVSASTTSIGDYSHTTGSYSGGSRTSSRPMYAQREVHIIDSDMYVYIVSRLLYWRWNKTADVTVNASIRLATDKQTMDLLDDEGREHKTQIIKRILKTPEFARALAATRGVSPGPQPTPVPTAPVVAIPVSAAPPLPDTVASNAPIRRTDLARYRAKLESIQENRSAEGRQTLRRKIALGGILRDDIVSFRRSN